MNGLIPQFEALQIQLKRHEGRYQSREKVTSVIIAARALRGDRPIEKHARDRGLRRQLIQQGIESTEARRIHARTLLPGVLS